MIKMIKRFFLKKKIEAELKNLLLELENTCQKLHDLIAIEAESFDNLVQFYNLTSKWFDRLDEIARVSVSLRSINYGQYDMVIEALEKLTYTIYSAGRCSLNIFFCLNKTKRFEVVTKDSIFIWAIETETYKSIPEWEKCTDANRKRLAWQKAEALIRNSTKSIFEAVIMLQSV